MFAYDVVYVIPILRCDGCDDGNGIDNKIFMNINVECGCTKLY